MLIKTRIAIYVWADSKNPMLLCTMRFTLHLIITQETYMVHVYAKVVPFFMGNHFKCMFHILYICFGNVQKTLFSGNCNFYFRIPFSSLYVLNKYILQLFTKNIFSWSKVNLLLLPKMSFLFRNNLPRRVFMVLLIKVQE